MTTYEHNNMQMNNNLTNKHHLINRNGLLS